MVSQPTPHSLHLRALAQRLGDAHVEHCGAAVVLLVGSSAEGISDEWSDIDLILFYEAFPSTEALAATIAAFAPTASVPLGGAADSGVMLEQHTVGGIACQLVHQTFEAWRAQSATVLTEHATESPVQKALQGLHAGLPLHGDERIAELRAAAAYPDELRLAMVRMNMGIFPLWRIQGSLRSRDADLWQTGEIVKALERILAMLAGVNRQWFSTFQLKKVGRLCDSFEHAPSDLEARIARALALPTHDAVEVVASLVADVATIIEEQMPEIDASYLRGILGPPVESWALP